MQYSNGIEASTVIDFVAIEVHFVSDTVKIKLIKQEKGTTWSDVPNQKWTGSGKSMILIARWGSRTEGNQKTIGEIRRILFNNSI